MIYLQDNILLEEPLRPEHVKHRLLGHWGTVPGLNLMYAGLNRLINDTQAEILLVTGPGHGAPANLANLWVDGCLADIRPDLSRDTAGLNKLIRSFSWPGGFPSHLGPMVPGTIHEGGELGYALAPAFGAALDNPGLIVACVLGAGEAERGPTAGAWHSNKFLDPATCGAVLPILHVNGYKIANPTIYKTMSNQELTKLFEGFGWHPLIVEGEDLDAGILEVTGTAHAEIREIQEEARSGGTPRERPAFPMIVLRSPKGWTGIKELEGVKITGTAKSHQVPAMQARTNPVHLAALEEWLASYRPAELFEENGGPIAGVLAACPTGDLRMGSNPHVIGGNMRKPLNLPDPAKHAVAVNSHGSELSSALGALGHYFADVFTMNADEKNFRIMCPDEVASNRLTPVFDVEDHAYVWPLDPEIDTGHRRDGRIMEILSEHNCQGWLQGYVLTGRHGVFPCYEAFIPIVDGMVNQYGKFLTISRNEAPWRPPVSGLNYLLSSVGWRQDHNGYSHQMPGFINSMLNRKEALSRIYLPADANALLVTMEKCLRSTDVINLIVASEHPLPQYMSIDEAKDHVARGASVWEWASNDDGEPDIVLAACGEIPTVELLAATALLREAVPELRVRFVNVNDLYALASSAHHPSGLSQAQFTQIFTKDRPVLFNFHGYPSAIHQLIHRRPQQARFHVRGYVEEGTTTTPFDLLAMNGVDRYQLAIEALTRADILAAEMLPGMSGEFAIRAVPDAEKAIAFFRSTLERLRATIRELGDDPAEVTDWSWSSGNGHGPLPDVGPVM